jgi:transcriptional regulator with XRE-family HTH domain
MAQGFIHDFGLAVRQLREARGWSQEELAAEAHLNRSYVGEIERGQVAPSLVTVHKLALALAVNPPQLLAHAQAIGHAREDRRCRLVAIAG